MPFLWLAVDDEPLPESMRAFLERNSIALLSNATAGRAEAVDPPSEGWLGRWCPSEAVRRSGLWNQRHVDDSYAPDFLDCVKDLVEM
jgi:hypothetical protein